MHSAVVVVKIPEKMRDQRIHPVEAALLAGDVGV
jgi:hypothetical protein